jgi:hypothetical protein
LRFFVFRWFLSQTSNLFVVNLPSNVTEHSLGHSLQIHDIQVDFPVQVSSHRPMDETHDGHEPCALNDVIDLPIFQI